MKIVNCKIENCFIGFILLLSIFYFLPFVASASTIARPILNSGLVGYWSFEEGAGNSKTYDNSGSGNTGTLINGPTWVNSSTTGQALKFDGTDDYVSVPNSSVLNIVTDKVTVSSWVKGTSPGNNAGIVFKNTAGGSAGYVLHTGASGNARFVIGNGSFNTTNDVGNIVWDGRWHMLTGIYDGVNLSIYVDGVFNNKVAVSGNISDNSNFSVGIGARSDGTFPFTGSIDEVRVYNRALSAHEVSRLYKLQKPKVASGINNTGLVGYWPLDEGQGTRAEDASFNNNTGTLILGPTWTSGKIGGAVNLDGSDDYVDLGNDSSLEVPLPFALSVWVKIRSLPSVNYNIIATDAHTGSSIYSGSGIWINSDGSVEIDYGDSISTGGSNHRRTKLSGAGLITANTWYHIVAVARGATDMNLYVNGVDVGGSYSGTGNAQVFSSDTAKIGSNAWGTLNAFSGSIDDARVYNRALSAGEVYALYKGTKATVVNKTNKNRVTDGLIGYWTFDGKDIYGTKANDVSSNGNTGTLTGGPTPVIGKLGQALSFDGVDDYLNTTNTVNIAKVTISAWIKIPSIPSTNNTIVGFANGFNHGTHDKVLYIKNDGKLYFYVYDGSANTTSAPSSTLPLKTWVHVVGIADGTTARTYVNGVEVGSVLSGNTYTSYGVPDIFIGAPISTGTYTYFNGQMDDVRVYNRALTVEEIKTLYSLGR